MKLIYLIPLLLIGLLFRAQTPSPGGVNGAIFWILSTEDNGEVFFNSPIQNNFRDSQIDDKSFYILNNNPAKYISEQSYSFEINDLTKDQMSIFCVYQLEDTLSEKHIWSLSQNQNLNYELSSFRFADLNSYSYRDLRVFSQKYPELHTYIHHKDSTNLHPYHLKIGAKSHLENLPIENFKGILPELVIFPRSLSNRDKQKVESYLGVKYGLNISASHPLDYLNSANKIWWSAKDHHQYHHRVFAIARDDTSGLFQTKSHSAYEPNLLKLNLNDSAELVDLEAIFIADNGENLNLSATENGNPLKTPRRWRISSNNFKEVDLTLDLRRIENRNEEEFLYLEIDQSGDPSQNTFPKNYLQISKQEKILSLENYLFDEDGNGADIFGIVQAPELFVQMNLQFPHCGESNRATIKTKVEGGEAPYTLKIKDLNGELIHQWLQNDLSEIYTFEHLSLGDYIIELNDDQGKSYKKQFYVQSNNVPMLQLQNEYELISGHNFTLDASKNMPSGMHYSWYYEGKLISNKAQLKVSKPGSYEIRTTTENGCTSRKSIEIKSQNADNIKGLQVFPNPSKGNYSVRIILERKADTYIDIFDFHGRKLATEYLGNDNYFLYRGFLKEAGIYLIQVRSEKQQKTTKLIIQP